MSKSKKSIKKEVIVKKDPLPLSAVQDHWYESMKSLPGCFGMYMNHLSRKHTY